MCRAIAFIGYEHAYVLMNLSQVARLPLRYKTFIPASL